MRRIGPMWRMRGGAALVVAGIAALIEASSRSVRVTHPAEGVIRVSWGGTAYDPLMIGGLVLLIVLGVIGYWSAQRPRRA